MADIMGPIKVKNVDFKNRVVMAPMVVFGLTSENGVMEPKLVDHYLKRAGTCIGLMISQALSVSPKEMISGGAGVYSDSHIEYLSKIKEECHQNGTRFFAQLAYPGFSYYDSNSKDINELTKEDLGKIRDEFINGAKICKKAGLDGIEMHGAHTFFLNMMASQVSNKREDEYGGDTNGRLFLLKEIVEGIKEFSDDNFIISYRMGWNESLGMDIKTAKAIEDVGIEMLHVSSGIPGDRKLDILEDLHYNEVVYTGCQIKKHVNIPVIAVNDIRTINRGNYLLENDWCDFVAYGRPFLADEDFMTHSSMDPDYDPCLRCKTCKWFENGDKCLKQMKTKKGQNGGII
ncbi:NADH:flavin oxidoreductase [Methanobacterium sp.]|uniref:NADH:flavin oxidoreductase n=1 Tax=Methanobacterium sp. TaxID=2164 RepID=UPI003C70CC17